MKMELSGSFINKLSANVEKYRFEVGVLDDKPHKLPVEDTGEGSALENKGFYAGGYVRKTSRQNSGSSIGQVLVENQKRLNINILWRPFEEPDSEIMRFTTEFLKLVSNRKVTLRRLENLLQAIVRNPILRQEYGSNTADAAEAKGFSRHLFDTGQMFKAIKARIKRV